MGTILVTGGAGFIGSHTCLLLLKKGYKIVVLDSLINSSKISLERVSKIVCNKLDIERIKLINGDIRDVNLLENIFSEAKFKKDNFLGVIHFAGLKAVEQSIKYPLEYWDNNVYGSINLLKIMDKYNCKTIVFSSSATVYKNTINNTNLDENSKLKPYNPYGETKLAIEKILSDIFKSSSEWRIANLRYFNPIGAHSSGLIGENPRGMPNNIFPIIARVALKKIEYLKVYGNDWNTHDGTGVRDYIHVMDLAQGHIAALEFLFKKVQEKITFNLGTGVGTSVIDLINTFKKENNIEIPFKIVGRRDGDIGYVVANNSLAKSILKWEPKYRLEDMCRDGWNWQKQNPEGY